MRKFAGLCLIAVLLVAGCSYIQKQAVPMHTYTATDIAAEGRSVGATVSETRYGFRVLTIPISIPEPVDMAETLVARHDAAGLTDLEVEMSELFAPWQIGLPTDLGNLIGLIVQVPKITVKGRLVK